MAPSTSFALASKISDPTEHLYDLEVLDEKRQNVENKWVSYQK